MRIAWVAILLVTTSGCSTSPPTVETTPTQTVVSGMKPFASFRASHGPGTVIRVDDEGIWRVVTSLPVDPQEASEVTYNISASRRFSAEQFFDLVVDRSKCANAGGSIGADFGGNVTVSSVDGTREYLNDESLDPAINNLRQRFATGDLQLRTQETYWMIRETIKTNNVTYESNKGWLIDANVSGALSSCAEAVASGEAGGSLFSGEGSFLTLNKTFEEPLRGWYLADRLSIEVPFGAAPGTAPLIQIKESASEGQPDL